MYNAKCKMQNAKCIMYNVLILTICNEYENVTNMKNNIIMNEINIFIYIIL